MQSRIEYAKYFVWLLVLHQLFCFRVIAQLLQALYPVDFLPPFEAWQSGVLPYRLLLMFQLIIVSLCTVVVIRFATRNIVPNLKAGRIYLIVGGTYFTAMVIRLVVGLAFAVEHHWFGAIIPTFFHLVLALFLLSLARFHCRYVATA